jgi:hypothetical protein
MQTRFTPFDLNTHNRSLSLELADADARQLLDIGLVRGADGSLRLAEDPAQLAGPGQAQRAGRAVFEALAGLFRWLRRLPLRGQNWHPHFFLRE